jgi:hypothetical protein
METLLSSITGLLSIIEARRIKELSNWRMLFLPLAVASGIFSISGTYALGGSSFWMYWVVALPLVFMVFMVFIIANGINSGPALWNARHLRTPTHGPVSEVPHMSPTDTV